MKWMCAQIGAREHYAIPRVMHQTGRLASLVTDAWAGPVMHAVMRQLPVRSIQRWAGRYHPELRGADVRSFNLRALRWELSLRGLGAGGRFQCYADIGKTFALAARRELERRRKRIDAVFAYDTGALELLEAARAYGIAGVVDQIDPGPVEEQWVREERLRWPGWEPDHEPAPEYYHARRRAEWAAARLVIVNSEFSRKALVAQGVPNEKLVVLPLSFAAGMEREILRWRDPARPLKVLFLGQVILRKGIQYLVEAARLLKDEAIEIHVVGSIGLQHEVVAAAPPTVVFHGAVARNEAERWYRDADVFVLPTISDGFALTQLEAMAHGLPVIATSSCGEVVQPERSGLLVPARDVQALAAAIRRFADDEAFRRHCANGALRRVEDFSPSTLASAVAALEDRLSFCP